MYYNIKIKSNGSEFSLESNNKEVLQREMDIYFAEIFDVSNEFKSNIKKIEITNENVKSINEFEAVNKPSRLFKENETSKIPQKTSNQLSEERIQELAKIKAQEIIEAQRTKIAQEEKRKLDYEKYLKEMSSQVKEVEIAPQINPVEIPTPTQTINESFNNFQNVNENPSAQVSNSTVKFENEPLAIKNSNVQEEFSTPSKLPDEILELINLAQRKIETIEKTPIQNTTPIVSEIKEQKTNEEIQLKESLPEVKFNNQTDNQKRLDDIFNTSISKEKETYITQEPAIQTPKDEIFDDSVEVSLADIEVTLQPQETFIKQGEVEHVFEPTEIQTNENQYDIVEETPPTQAPRVTLSQMASNLDFKPFLSGYAPKELSDEFLICAYFIKNVLKQSDFTMKFINSKLFQATGKIADMSIIDELITKEYIRIIDTDEGKKYCITMDGEGYFAEKFQG